LLPKLCTRCGVRYPLDALFCPTDGLALLPARAVAMHGEKDPYVGRQIAGHIEILELIGTGAMGRVYRAFQSGIDRDVAVKILHRELASNRELVTRFHREAKIASRLTHPNVVQVYLSGQLPEGGLYIVMEYLDGMSLHSALLAQEIWPLPRALHAAIQLCEAVGEAHAQGIVHRDLKPENIMLVHRGADRDHVKVLDFGIARITWSEQSMATETGLIFGTARYISPEGAQGQHVTAQSDVYSLAILIYQMLSGKPPFDAEQAVALLIAQIHEMPPELRSQKQGARVPEALARAVMKNLAKDPAARDPDARVFGRELLEAARVSGFQVDELIAPSLFREALAPRPNHAPERGDHVRFALPVREDCEVASLARSDLRFADTGVALAAPAGPVSAEIPVAPHAAFADPRLAQAPNFATARLEGMVPNRTVNLEPERTPKTEIASATSPLLPVLPVLPAWAGEGCAPAPAVRPRSSGMAQTPSGEPPEDGDAESVASRERSHPESERPTRPTAHKGVHKSVRSTWTRSALVVVACFFLGGLVSGLIAYQRGVLGSGPSGQVDGLYTRAERAFRAGHFIEPPGDNVRELTDAALRLAPSDARVIALRRTAARALALQAADRKRAGELGLALQNARVAQSLDASDADSQALIAQLEVLLERESDAPDRLSPLSSKASALALAPTAPSLVAAAAAATQSDARVSGPRMVLTHAPSQPRSGQLVEFAATVVDAAAQKTQAADAAFVVTGPGIRARLPATLEGAVYRASLSFFDAGTYSIQFSGIFNTRRVEVLHVLVVAGPGPSPGAATSPSSPSPREPSPAQAPAPSSDAPAPKPTGTVRWL
jgi:eukaryotic-like serine/threonine-protein kinase